MLKVRTCHHQPAETCIGYNNTNAINGGNSFFPGVPRSLLGRNSLGF